jgi:hypothetical protein
VGNKGHHRGKADSVEWLEGSNPGDVNGDVDWDTTGVLRAGHVFTGVTRELGRANCLLTVE